MSRKISDFCVRTRIVGQYLYIDVPGFAEIKPDHVHLQDARVADAIGSKMVRKSHELLLAFEERMKSGTPLPAPMESRAEGPRSKIFDISLGEFARLKGWSEDRVRRAADAGLLPCEKTSGGHRKFSALDL